LEVRESKLGVAQPVAERVERRPGHVEKFGGVLVVRIRRPSRVLVVVVERQLSHGAREGDGELAAGVHVAEEHVGDGRAGLRAREPRLKDGGRILGGPVNRERSPVHEHDGVRLARGVNRFD
jgi:hypothetical protein